MCIKIVRYMWKLLGILVRPKEQKKQDLRVEGLGQSPQEKQIPVVPHLESPMNLQVYSYP